MDHRLPTFLIVPRTFLGSTWIHWEIYWGGGLQSNILFLHIHQFDSSAMWTKHQSVSFQTCPLIGCWPPSDFALVHLYLSGAIFPAFFFLCSHPYIIKLCWDLRSYQRCLIRGKPIWFYAVNKTEAVCLISNYLD